MSYWLRLECGIGNILRCGNAHGVECGPLSHEMLRHARRNAYGYSRIGRDPVNPDAGFRSLYIENGAHPHAVALGISPIAFPIAIKRGSLGMDFPEAQAAADPLEGASRVRNGISQLAKGFAQGILRVGRKIKALGPTHYLSNFLCEQWSESRPFGALHMLDNFPTTDRCVLQYAVRLAPVVEKGSQSVFHVGHFSAYNGTYKE